MVFLSHALFVFSMFGLLSVKLICALNGFLALEFAGRARRLPAKLGATVPTDDIVNLAFGADRIRSFFTTSV